MDSRQKPIEAAQHPARLEYLDGVRGLAALFVLAHHLWHSYTRVALPGIAGFCANWLLYGHLSVDVFIVLSGFCLMLPVARSGGLRGGWRHFYKARARRILPPLYAALLASMAVPMYYHYFFSNSEIAANCLLIQDIWQSKNTIDGPLWSVAVEWKIYFLFPAFVWLRLRYGSQALLVAAALLSAILDCFLVRIPCVTNIGLVCPWYLLLFAMGMVASDIASRARGASSEWPVRRIFIGALAVLAIALWMWPVTSMGEEALYEPHFPLIDTFTGFAAAIFLLMLGRRPIGKDRSLSVAVLSWKPLVFIGTMGYSLYLIHLPLIYPLKALLLSRLPFHPPWVVIPLVMALTVGTTYLFHLIVERPFMSKRSPAKERREEIAAMMHPAR